MSSLPLAIVLDLDGTIIGDITPQIVSYDILREVKALKGQLNYKAKDLDSKLKTGIVRPYFVEFIKRIKSKIPHAEVFVYTASEKTWAFHIIKQIEKSCGVKINRPIFTRNHCTQLSDGSLQKCIKTIRPAIFRALKNKYGLERETVLMNRVLLVDNRPVYGSPDSQFLIQCPTYDFKVPENIPAMVDSVEYAKYFKVFNGIFRKYYNVDIPTDYYEFQEQFYTKYARELARLRDDNRRFLQDTFYKSLYKLIIHIVNNKGHNRFDQSAVKFINKQLKNKNVDI